MEMAARSQTGTSSYWLTRGRNSKRMKKYFVSILMVMVAIACVTGLTACGGDDDDDLPGQEPGTVTF